MWSKSWRTKFGPPHSRRVDGTVNSSAQVTANPAGAGSFGSLRLLAASAILRTHSVTVLSAVQSSALYVSNFCFQMWSRLCSHRALQTRLWRPDAFSSVHAHPRCRPTDFSPFDG